MENGRVALWRWGLTTLGLLGGSFLFGGLAQAQQIHRNGFETGKLGWAKGGFDAPYEEKVHAVSDQTAQTGRHSEQIRIDAKAGTFIYYTYPTGKALVGEELSAGVWVKANRPGIQLMARLVLPRERDPNNLDNVQTTYLRGDAYQNVGKWQRLELPRPMLLAKQQQQLLQAQAKRAFDFHEAYVDALVLNLYAGPGPAEVWIDDVEVGPIMAGNVFQPAVRPSAPPDETPATPTNVSRPAARAPVAEFKGNHLVVGNKRMLFRGIRVTDTPLSALREARFNTVFVGQNAGHALLREAGEEGLYVVPMLRALDEGQPTSQDALTRELNKFGSYDSTLFVHLGESLQAEQAQLVSRAVQTVRTVDPGRVVGGDVWDGMMPYSRTLNLMGVHRWPLWTMMELPQYRQYLKSRRDLANPGVFMWTWIQTHMPDWQTQLLYDRPASASFDEPVGPQPEQIQLLTYTALASGCRGLAFWSDRFLADSHQGRDRLLCCALMNLEMEMLEPLLVRSDDTDETEWVPTSVPDVKAAVLRSPLGVLVLPVWQGKFSQFVPGQAAVSKLSVVVPQVSQSTQAWEVSPGEVRGLKAERVAGGMKVTLPEFGLTSAIVFTSSTELVGRFQEQAKSRRQIAAKWAYDMATYELEKVLQVEDRLEKLGHALPDGQALVQDAQKRLAVSKQLMDSRVFSEAYREAQRALRPVRIVMRAQWEQAVRGLDTPVTSPYAVSYYTLPRHWQLVEQIRASRAEANALPGGDFEQPPQRPEEAWRLDPTPSLDEVDLIARRVTDTQAHVDAPLKQADGKTLPDGQQCAMLRIKPKGDRPAPPALERTHLALSSPAVRLQPGTLVRVTAWVHIPAAIASSADGALLYDSAGGEPMGIRLTDVTPWKKYTLYRRVPASGTMNVTLALTGVGTVYFDDVRIEPLVPADGAINASAR